MGGLQCFGRTVLGGWGPEWSYRGKGNELEHETERKGTSVREAAGGGAMQGSCGLEIPPDRCGPGFSGSIGAIGHWCNWSNKQGPEVHRGSQRQHCACEAGGRWARDSKVRGSGRGQSGS
eukprot:4890966-Pyramimonas_sp.AAC.2